MFVLASGAVCADTARVFDTELHKVRVTTVATGLEHPWSVAFLPDGKFLVTERPGRLRIIDAKGNVSAPLQGVPKVAAAGQGGLLDVVLAPDFAQSRRIYFSYAEPRDGGNGASVARAKLGSTGLSDVEVIFRQLPAVESQGHLGSRLVFARDGSLFVTLGERQLKHFAVRAQDLETHFGKIVHLQPDGGAAPDNPFLLVPGAQPEIWSYGHRNVQGAALHPDTGELWTTEHGPKGGDELNRVKPGANYGWPLVTYGIAYNGDKVGVGQERVGIEPPVYYWVPSIATSGLTFYTGDRFPKWHGQLFAGGLYGMVVRLQLEGEKVVKEERILTQLKQRIRDVRTGPDGLLYVLTDSPKGELISVAPAE
ncbi:PQQ-dependent sugar dehydrogenase [Steroidobacter cummioxidans]|uniref:PQQ-dependent sugar dehydrogenase n=1 Tax=Steroidobacter cummioxidans TaxID=1803913 RepID=UPI000E32025E|nr:PQQ-dependent sugar dehydrogenase [Steroidobacter cummioxidans]